MTRFDAFLGKRSWMFFSALVAYWTLCHVFCLGFTSWDGFITRVPPIVNWLHHGTIDVTLADGPVFYRKPLFEFAHAPFLWLLGLKGLYFSFALVWLPLATWAVSRCGRIMGGSRRCGLYAGAVFLAIPFVSEQAFSGYVDFCVLGAFAFFVSTLIECLEGDRGPRTRFLFVTSTVLFSFARLPSLYFQVITFVGFLFLWRSPKPANDQARRSTTVLFALAILPAVLIHLQRWWEYGTPIFPYQFSLFGWESASGLRLDQVLVDAGLSEGGIAGAANAFIRGWLWPEGWPRSFFDSRWLGAGLLFWMVVGTVPLWWSWARKQPGVCLLWFVVPLVSKGLLLPRLSIFWVLLFILLVATALDRCLSRKRSFLYGLLMGVLVLQSLGRPIYTACIIGIGDLYYPRANLAQSPLFIQSEPDDVLRIRKDQNASMFIVHPLRDGFQLGLYGPNLTNRVVGCVPSLTPIDPAVIKKFEALSERHGSLLVVDATGRFARAYGLRCVPGSEDACPRKCHRRHIFYRVE